MSPSTVCKPQPHWLIAGWLELMESGRGENCPSGQRRGPAEPLEDNVPSPEQKDLHAYIYIYNSNNPGTEINSHGSIAIRTVCNPQPHWLIADWLELVEPAHCESCPSGQRRGPAAPWEDNFPSPDHKFFHISTIPTTRGRNGDSPGRYCLARCGNSNSTGRLLICWGS